MRIHRTARTVLAATLLAFTANDVGAQSVGRIVVRDIANSAGDAWAILTSPLHGKPSDWLMAGAAFAGAAAVSPWDDDVDRWAVKQRNDAVWSPLAQLREGGAAFSGRQVTPVVLGLYAVGIVARSAPLREGLIGCATAYGATSVVRTFVVYPIVARTRPDSGHSAVKPPPAESGDQYEIHFPGTRAWGRHSFPGGHITNVAACAAFLTKRYSLGIAAPLPWLVVGGVAVGRTLDRRHWLSDEVIGGVFGYAVGHEIAVRSLRRSRRQAAGAHDGSRTSLFAAPAPGGISLGVRTSF
jgi:membrane-associated phospholipid phosphatase